MSGPAGPLKPEELDRLQALEPRERAAWALEELARLEEAWLLEDAEGWVLFKLDPPPAQGRPWALPLWPRQELAALGARDASEQPRSVDLETLLEELLPQVAESGWRVLACPGPQGGALEDAERFAAALADAWTALDEEA